MMITEVDTKAPKRATIGSCGYDIYSPIETTFYPGESVTFDTGICLTDEDYPAMRCYMYDSLVNAPTKCVITPIEWCILVLPRSSFGSKYGLSFDNTVSVIDSDYRDSIKLFISVTKELHIEKGERFAQMIVFPHCLFANEETPLERRTGGIGSTGR